MTGVYLNVFNAYGKPDRDILAREEATIDKLPDHIRATLFHMVKAVDDRDDCQTRKDDAVKAVRVAEHTYNNAVMAFDQTGVADGHLAEGLRTPKQRHAQGELLARARRDAAAAQKPGYKSKKPKINSLKTAVDEANAVLVGARAALLNETAELHKREVAAGEWINKWRQYLTAPSADDVRRQYVAASQAERERQVAAGEIEVADKSELDKVLGARGKTKTNRQPVFYR